MKTLAVITKWCGHLWMGLFAIIVALSIIGTFLSEPTFATGWRKFSERFRPYSLANIVVTIVLLAPGVGLYRVSQYFDDRS